MNYRLASTTWGDEEIAALKSVIDSGQFTMGKVVKSFENEFASFVNTKFALMLNSGSSANLALLAGCRYRNKPLLNEGDEVLVPAVSWSTTYYPVSQLGCSLKFVDIDSQTLNIDVEQIKNAISPKTKAIFGVNLLGNPADWGEISKLAIEKDLILLEDNCESLGAQINGRATGTFGIGGTFSSFFSHHISTMEGGMLVTDDENLFEACTSLRAHGWIRDLPNENSVFQKTGTPWDDLFRFVLPGYNLRPLEMEAAVGLIQLRKLPEFISWRRKNAIKFVEAMKNFENYRIQKEHGQSSWFGFSIILENKLATRRDELVRFLSERNIESRPIVSGNFAKNPVLKHLRHAPVEELPVADKVHFNGLFVGNHHYDLSDEIAYLALALNDFERLV